MTQVSDKLPIFRPRCRLRTGLAVILSLSLVLCQYSGCKRRSSTSSRAPDGQPHATVRLDLIQSVVSSEELILTLTPRLKWLSHGLMDLRLPDERGRKLFADDVKVTGLQPAGSIESTDSSSPVVTVHSWQAQSLPTTLANSELNLWPEFIQLVDFFESAQFYFVDGQFANASTTDFESNMGCSALARMKDGKVQSISARLKANWELHAQGQPGEPDDWRIATWTLLDFQALETTRTLFEDVTDIAIADPQARFEATRSLHHEFFVENYFKYVSGEITNIQEPYDYSIFFPDVTFEPPGLSVVDIDGDGWDDLYVCMQRGKNFLFRNRGDGTFEEIGAAVGLDLQGGSTCAAFADFDNDGDNDVFIGRARLRSVFLINDKGKFVDRSDDVFGQPLPYMVSSVAVADYNLDGLLDIYLGTYCPVEGGLGAGQKSNPMWLEAFMTPEQGVELKRRLRQAHKILNMVGPPNVLYENLGGTRFGVSAFNEQLESWKRCLQVAWSDYDQDGDPDVYLSNDYAPDQLFRNDREKGFAEVTNELGLDTLGFGMGVSWGDYDNDAKLDVYASNMYSKAGARITRQFDGLDPRFQAMAHGNYLYRFDGEKFHLKSGYPDEEIHVSKAGWSWGGQFTDFNNDGFQDLYVASGYHTAPEAFAVDIDL